MARRRHGNVAGSTLGRRRPGTVAHWCWDMISSRHTTNRPALPPSTIDRGDEVAARQVEHADGESKVLLVVLAAALLCSPALLLFGGTLERLDRYTVVLAVLASVALAVFVLVRVARLITRAEAARGAARTAMSDALTLAAERREAEDEMRRQALYDSLTALPNRTLFLDRLGLAVDRARRSGTSAAVLFCDLDHFKLVNDSLGHDAGDAVLNQLAHRLSGVLRPGDTVARFGGDEFTMLCEDLRSPDQALSVASRVAESMRAPIQVGDTEVHMTASIGIALAPEHSDEPDRLLRDAEATMYRAKERGRAHHAMFDPAVRSSSTSRLRVESDLRRALERKELTMVYQPIVDIESAEIGGFEALLIQYKGGR